MVALFGNLSVTEILVIGIVAVLIFGKRLPEVASQTYDQIRKIRGGIDQFRRDTGIEREMRTIERSIQDIGLGREMRTITGSVRELEHDLRREPAAPPPPVQQAPAVLPAPTAPQPPAPSPDPAEPQDRAGP